MVITRLKNNILGLIDASLPPLHYRVLSISKFSYLFDYIAGTQSTIMFSFVFIYPSDKCGCHYYFIWNKLRGIAGGGLVPKKQIFLEFFSDPVLLETNQT
ncbi:hypothetical protein DFA_12371 [Cavenderia fasciculata]|uniref:Uncharacterized protein n=1 Tax=Cavenderia fasciculata TaxID=261658 RepID=F4QDH5_CACFS|nr:uncharacterized protein DFA_12371 [Cavenderia fasciculata]EGG14593.1 hypothetical protein DFA_12371 [Cavenderia fasciculata]|eukprot:XP_004366113.1 hypothetical protein DFA_12371 [Cavenderia fasciculata]